MELSKDQQRIFLLKKIRRISLWLLIPAILGISLTANTVQVRMIGAFCIFVGTPIITSGLIMVVRREAKMGGRGVGSHIVRGFGAVAYGWLNVFFGSLIFLFGSAALVLPFGFFS